MNASAGRRGRQHSTIGLLRNLIRIRESSEGVGMLWLPPALLLLAVVTLSWVLAAGPAAFLYLTFYGATAIPGLPVGFALFGRRHAAGWIGGALIGYAATAFAVWLCVQAGITSGWGQLTVWIALCAVAVRTLRGTGPLVTLPVWTRRDALALVLVLFAVLALVWKPFVNIGYLDETGARRYRAYFTADFLWHIALTAELARFTSPPRNPYLASRPLHYYWGYFVVPAAAVRFGIAASPQAALTINAVCAGLLFVAAVFLFVWCAVPRAGPAAIATLIALLAASAEGLYAIQSLWSRGAPIDGVRHLNIDAITSWFFRGLTVDGLPRSLWYTPQHAAACALSLVGMLVIPAASRTSLLAGLLAGVPLGLGVVFSPVLGGTFSLIYGLAALVQAARAGRRGLEVLTTTVPAALPVLLALGWCVESGTFEGAGGSLAFGFSRLAAAAPFAAPALALGPLLALALPGAALARRSAPRLDAAVAALFVGFGLYYFAFLRTEPVWIGWRAGQILLVTLPALAAASLAALVDRGLTSVAAGVSVLVVAAGLPTTIIDAYNAQDVRNTAMGPGFRWTVVVGPDSQAALDWIRRHTPQDSIVQMSIGPRGRETWTLVPTFAERRMAAGRPISLLDTPEYAARSAEVDGMYQAPDPAESARLARRLRIDYVYVDAVERAALAAAALAKFEDPRFFSTVFQSGAARVYAVR